MFEFCYFKELLTEIYIFILITYFYLSQEIHILKQFDKDFYGSNLKIKVVGFIRPELNFNSVGKMKILLICFC